MQRLTAAITTLAVAAALAAAGALAACDDLAGGGCTEIGCTDGVFVDFDQPRPGDYDASFVVDGEVTTFACAGGTVSAVSGPMSVLQCGAEGFTIAGTPARVELNAGGADGSWQAVATLDPAYEELRPNGPGCPPVCLAAEAALTTTTVSR